MPDAGEIKAKVTIEYDGSGVEKAKEDLASLAEASGAAGSGASNASEGLAQLGERASGASEGVAQLAENASSLEKPMQTGQTVVTELTDALGEHQAAIEQAGESYKALQEPLGATVSMLENAGPPMLAIGQHAQVVAEQLGPVGGSFAQLGDSLSQSVPLLPSFAESMHVVDSTLAGSSQGLSNFHENMAVFQDAMENPSPFSMINQHLTETGQTWGDFASSIGSDNVQMLHEMASTSDTTHQVLGGMASSAQAVGQTFYESADSAKAFTDQFNSLNGAATDVNKSIGETSIAVEDVGKASTGGGFGGFLSDAGGAFGGVFGGVMNAMNAVAMPLMAVQMIGMAVSTVATGMYNAAAIAEGPAAHGVGTFTGSVDALNQTMAKSGQTFSETFGQQMIPTITALNDTTSKGGGFSGLGGILGGAGSFLANLAQVGVGGPFLQSGLEGFANQGAQLLGQPLPYPGPAATNTQQAAIQQQIALIPQQIALSTATMQAQASSPAYLAAQASLSSAQQQAVVAQGEWKDSHIGGSTGPLDPLNNIIQAEMVRYAGGSYGGTPDPNAAFFNSFAPRGYNSQQGLVDTGGCFPAGTCVRQANGGERAIEALQPGDQVIAHDGIKQIPTVVLARIVPPPKCVYELTFSDGNTLTLTNAHPIASLQGWKSLSPAATKEENPDLDVAELCIGDHIYTSDDVTCTLITIEKRDIVQVYNITVDEPHTFYANGVLVHNKFSMMNAGQDISTQIADQVSGIQLPHIDLSGISSSLSGAFSGIQLPHLDLSSIGADLGGAFSGISLPHIDLSGIGASLSGAFSGIQLPHIDLSGIGASLSSAFSGISLPSIPDIGSQISSQLSSMFSGISLPSIPDIGSQISSQLSNMFSGISLPSIPQLGSQIGSQLSNMFSGISLPSVPELGAMLTGAMAGVFGGITLPSVPQLGAMITGAMSGMFSGITLPSVPDLGAAISGMMTGMFSGIVLPQVPFFADGVTNFSGGPAVVGEAGTEAVTYNGQTALFSQGAALVNLPAGSSVYPMQDMANYALSSRLGQAGAGVSSPISIGGGIGGGGPQSVNLTVQIDSQSLITALGMPLAANMRVGLGLRN